MMKPKTSLLFFTLLVSISVAAQIDTTFYYWNKDGKSCDKDTATSYGKTFQKDDKWIRKEFRVKNNLLYFEGMYLDKDLKKPHGKLIGYRDDGSPGYITQCDSGKTINKTYYHANGNKKGYINYVDNFQQGWDEKGNEIKNYVVERTPQFGKEWKNYIATSVNAKIAVDAGLPEGQYKVMVRFSIDKEGKITDVVATDVPQGCLACGTEAIRVISSGPTFTPAILNNEVVIFKAIQPVVFVVADDEVKPNKKRSR